MSKRKNKNKQPGTGQISGILPEFRAKLESEDLATLDFSAVSPELRMSTKLIQVMKPFYETIELELLLDLTTIAWNECVEEDFGRSGSYSLSNGLLNFSIMREVIDELKERKRFYCMDDERHVIEARAYLVQGDVSINVAFDYGNIAKEGHETDGDSGFVTEGEGDGAGGLDGE
jgi:hypothetical protein